jgi:glycosyltransferase involved in cell wall biosynthesis
MHYVCVVNARNEEDFIEECLESVFNQTKKARMVILVDDNSDDSTVELASKYLDRNNFIIIKCDYPRYNKRGINQALVFNKGVYVLNGFLKFDAILKVDCDSVLPPDYVNELLFRMKNDDTIGICSGIPSDTKIRMFRVSDGARLIRKECYEDIGGYSLTTGFDSHALLKASYYNWCCVSFDDVKYKELRGYNKKKLSDWYETGVIRKNWGFSKKHTLLASMKNMLNGSPKIINGIVMMYGYLFGEYTPDRELDREWVKEYGNREIKYFWNKIKKEILLG